MAKLSKLVDPNGRPLRVPARLRARHEIGDPGHIDAKLFLNATGADADATDTLESRQRARNIARYEYRNNSYCRGVVSTVAGMTIGSGSRVSIECENTEGAREAEKVFAEWGGEVGLAEKLIVGRTSRCIDGGTFWFEKTNDRLFSPIKLDYDLIEEDQVTTPDLGQEWARQGHDFPYPAVDGLTFDRAGNVELVWKLNRHPGAMVPVPSYETRATAYPWSQVLYDYRIDRPGQHRGFSELAPCVFLFAEMRRVREAVIKAAERAASFSAVMQTTLPPDAVCADLDTEDGGTGLARLDVPVDSLLQLPEGWEMGQMRAEQPATTYAEFMDHLFREAISCLLLPYNVGASDSSDYNFASGRLDYQKWDKAVDIDHTHHQERRLLNRIFEAWYAEARLLGVVPDLGPYRLIWHWDEREPLDISKHMMALATAQQMGCFDEVGYWAQKGMTVEEGHARIKRAMDSRAAAGLPDPPSVVQQQVKNDNSEDS